MRCTLLLSLLLWGLSPSFAQLEEINFPYQTGLSDIEVLAPDSLIVLGTFNGRIYRTFDHGLSWQFFPIETKTDTVSFNRISFPNPQHGWVSTTEIMGGGVFVGGHQYDELYRTVDGGQNWEPITPAYDTNLINIIQSFFFFNKDTGLCFHNGRWLRTENGGDDWVVLDLEPAIDFLFNENGEAYLFNPLHNFEDIQVKVFYTNDYGRTWKKMDYNLPALDSRSIQPFYFGEFAYVRLSDRILIFRNGMLIDQYTIETQPRIFIGGEKGLVIKTDLMQDMNGDNRTQLHLFRTDDGGRNITAIDTLGTKFLGMKTVEALDSIGFLLGGGSIVQFSRPLSNPVVDRGTQLDRQFFRIYPNAARNSDDVMVTFAEEDHQPVRLSIINIQGNMLFKQLMPRRVNFSLSDLWTPTPGIYFVLLENKEKSGVRRLIIH